MSWEDYKKQREEESSWEQYKKQRENPVQISTNKSSNAPISQNIKNFMSATGKIGENTYKNAENGILSSIQNLGRNMFNLQGRKEEENIFDKVNKQILDSRKDLSSEERTSIIDKMNNSSFSQKNLIKGIEEKNQKFQEKKNENTLKIQQNADSISNPVGKYIAGEIAPGIGQMLPGMLPGIGTTYFISSATGNYHDDAIQRGMTEDQATIYSGTMGIIEGALESLGANLTKNVGKQLLKKNIKGALVNYGLDIGENFLEESIVEPISEIAAQVYGGKDKADWSSVGQRMIESGVAGALTSAITGGASAMIGGIGSKVNQQNQYVDYNTNKKLNKDSQNWLKQAENIIQENSTPKLSPQLAQNQQNTTAQQITPTIQNNAQNGISEQTNNAPISQEKQQQIIQNKLNTEIQQATQNKTSKGKVTLGKVSENIAQKVKTLLGINVENRTHILSDNDIRHMLNEHGDPIKESKKGQIAITTEDISKIPEIISSYDDIIKGNVNKNGETIRYIKNFEDGTTYMVEVVPENSKTLNVKTMWKKPTTLTNNQQIPSSTPMTTDSSISSTTNTIIPQNNPNMQEKNVKTPFRTSEQIANDTKISDIDAIKEESNKINTPTREIALQTENDISSKTSIQTVTSPTIDLINKKRSKEKATITEIKDTLAQKFVNKGHYIDKLAMKTGNKNLTYLYDRTMTAFTEAQVSIGDRQIITNEKGTDVEEVGKSIIDIFSEADNANLSNEFDDYLLNKHNIARYAHEKGIFGSEISATDSQNIVDLYEKQHPEFIKWSQEVSAYNDNNLKDLVRNGLVSKETYENLRTMYKDYVPTFRDITDNVQQYVDDKVGNNTLGKATQSDKTILSVKESMAEQTIAIKKAIRMNNLGVELYKTLGKDSKVNESVSGIGFDPVAIQTLAGDVIAKATDGTNTFMIFQDGEMTEFKISNELYSAFAKDTLQNKINESKVLKAILTPAEKLSKAQRELLTTYSIGFAFNNPIKDFQDALFNTKYSSAQFLKNYTKALYNIGTDGSWFESYKNNGGTANTYFDYDKGILPSKNKKFGDKIKKLNNILEQAPRLAEYISTIENGGNIDEALYNAADITTNFKRGGDITKVANKYGANFLNASVQGLDKFYRNLSGQNGWKGYANLVVKATIWQVAPAIINGLLLGDDEDYEDLPEYTKDNYFLFKIGDGKFFRIPKGRPSSVVGGIARRVLETSQGKEVDWKSLVDTTINQMAPNNPLTDNLLAPIKDASQNKTWYGGEIVSSRLQKLPNVEQYDESTDKVSKWIAKQVDKLPEKAKKTFSNLPVINKGYDIVTSPKKLNYVLDQYLGGAGDVILPMLTPQAENNILEDKFTTDSVMKNKHVSEYYSQLEELEKNKNSEKSTDIDQLKYMYLSGSSKELGELYQQKRDVQNSDLSDEEKKTQVREVQKKINAIVENKLENVDSIQKNGDTATIGEEKYYKYKGEWKQLSEEEAKKIKGISLNTYANYQNKVATLSDAKKKKDESVSQKDRVKILDNANYTANEKDKIYTQIINTDDNTYQILKKLDSNKNIINQYLDYLQADLEADREDDGTEKGKAISGSKKKKVSNYINSIDSKDMSYVQKLYLAGINTTLSAPERKKIYTYIKENTALTSKEKLEALDKLQGFTVYKNGKVDW